MVRTQNIFAELFSFPSYMCIMWFQQVVKWWNWHWILNCLFTFLFSAGSKQSLCKFCNEISQPFLNLDGVLNEFHRNIKKQNKKNHSIFNTNFNIQGPVQMTWSTHYSFISGHWWLWVFWQIWAYVGLWCAIHRRVRHATYL